jgi:hypothetical protein
MKNLNFLKQFVADNQNNTFKYEQPPEDTNIYRVANWILSESKANWLKLAIDAPYAEMLAEARALKERFVRHRDDQSEGWRSLAVHGVASHMTNTAEVYGLDSSTVTYQWTDVAEQCPVTVEYFNNVFPYRSYHRLRFMLVEPQGYIMPHSDNPYPNLGGAVNISLNNPEGCRLVTKNGTLPFENTGSAFLFNTHYDHAVYNDSNEDRFHIIVHGVWNDPAWSQLVVKSYQQVLNG